MAGLIYGLIHRIPEDDIIRFASSAAFGKFLEIGDATRQDVQTIRERAGRHT